MTATFHSDDWQLPLFVYGTLKSTARNSITDVLMQGARLLGAAQCQGRLYLVDYYPGVVASTNVNEIVAGELYQLVSAAQLAALDDYEECGVDAAHPAEFIRQIQAVTLANGQKVEAWVYLYTRPVKSLPCIKA